METSENAVSKSSLKDTGIRLLFVIFFAGVYTVAEFVIAALVVIQFGFKLITGETNEKLQSFSKPLNKYVYAILQFVTFLESTEFCALFYLLFSETSQAAAPQHFLYFFPLPQTHRSFRPIFAAS